MEVHQCIHKNPTLKPFPKPVHSSSHPYNLLIQDPFSHYTPIYILVSQLVSSFIVF